MGPVGGAGGGRRTVAAARPRAQRDSGPRVAPMIQSIDYVAIAPAVVVGLVAVGVLVAGLFLPPALRSIASRVSLARPLGAAGVSRLLAPPSAPCTFRFP